MDVKGVKLSKLKNEFPVKSIWKFSLIMKHIRQLQIRKRCYDHVVRYHLSCFCFCPTASRGNKEFPVGMRSTRQKRIPHAGAGQANKRVGVPERESVGKRINGNLGQLEMKGRAKPETVWKRGNCSWLRKYRLNNFTTANNIWSSTSWIVSVQKFHLKLKRVSTYYHPWIIYTIINYFRHFKLNAKIFFVFLIYFNVVLE